MSRPKAPLWLMTLLAFSGTVGMYIFVPALPYAARALSTSAATVQLTISLYLIGIALGQLVYGPLSDQFGRRPVLIAGLVLFTLAGVACAFATRADVLVVLRLLQGLGGSAGLVLGRAMVRDAAGSSEAARELALMNLMVTLGPGLSPMLGAALADSLGWRSVLGALALLGITNLALSIWSLRETLPRELRQPPSWHSLRTSHLRLLRSRAFPGHAIGGALATTAVYGLYAASPFLFVEQLQRPLHEAGIFLTLLVSGMLIGSYATVRLLRRWSARSMLVHATLANLLLALAFLALAAAGGLGLVSVTALMFAYAVGVGVTAPTALAVAVEVEPDIVGTASGLYGFAQMAVGAACSAAVGLGSDPSLAVGMLLVGAGIVALAAFALAARPAAG